MMPLTLANTGEELMIRKVGGSPEVRQHLETLGFVAGGTEEGDPVKGTCTSRR